MQRPTSVNVFGILNIVWGLFGVLGGIATAMMVGALGNAPAVANNPVLRIQSGPWMLTWITVNLVLGFIASIALVVAGIGLLNMRPWGRKISLG
jgi:hypothetical protein